MPLSDDQKREHEARVDAAVALRRAGMSAAEAAAQLGTNARQVRRLCEGVDLDAAPEPEQLAPAKSNRRRPRRRDPFTPRLPRPFFVGSAPGGLDYVEGEIERVAVNAEEAGRPPRIEWREVGPGRKAAFRV
jgi:hypothetical protein